MKVKLSYVRGKSADSQEKGGKTAVSKGLPTAELVRDRNS